MDIAINVWIYIYMYAVTKSTRKPFTSTNPAHVGSTFPWEDSGLFLRKPRTSLAFRRKMPYKKAARGVKKELTCKTSLLKRGRDGPTTATLARALLAHQRAAPPGPRKIGRSSAAGAT